MKHDRSIGLLIVLIALGFLVRCSQSPSPDPTKLKVTDISVGRSVGTDKTIAEKTDSFRPADTIYVSIRTEGSAPRATLKARWSYQDGRLVNESEQTIVPQGSAVTEFHISKPDGWPAGEYKVEVHLNDAPATSKTFKVI